MGRPKNSCKSKLIQLKNDFSNNYQKTNKTSKFKKCTQGVID